MLALTADAALAQQVSPPSAKDSVQFLAIGDTGTGDRARRGASAEQPADRRCSAPGAPYDRLGARTVNCIPGPPCPLAGHSRGAYCEAEEHP